MFVSIDEAGEENFVKYERVRLCRNAEKTVWRNEVVQETKSLKVLLVPIHFTIGVSTLALKIAITSSIFTVIAFWCRRACNRMYISPQSKYTNCMNESFKQIGFARRNFANSTKHTPFCFRKKRRNSVSHYYDCLTLTTKSSLPIW